MNKLYFHEMIMISTLYTYTTSILSLGNWKWKSHWKILKIPLIVHKSWCTTQVRVDRTLCCTPPPFFFSFRCCPPPPPPHFFFEHRFVFHINNILQLSMYHCMTYIQYIQTNTELQIKKNSCQTLGPASKRVLPDLSTFCQTYFFLEIF